MTTSFKILYNPSFIKHSNLTQCHVQRGARHWTIQDRNSLADWLTACSFSQHSLRTLYCIPTHYSERSPPFYSPSIQFKLSHVVTTYFPTESKNPHSNRTMFPRETSQFTEVTINILITTAEFKETVMASITSPAHVLPASTSSNVFWYTSSRRGRICLRRNHSRVSDFKQLCQKVRTRHWNTRFQ
jgi:hypothetical protein